MSRHTPADRPAPVRVAVHHVGCKLNQYEAEAFQSGFGARGFQVVPFGERADVCVVNTCTVTGSGDADSRRAVRRARRDNPSALVVATGCYAQRRPAEIAAAGAGLVLGHGDKATLVDAVAARLAGDAAAPEPPAGRAPRTERFLQIDGAVTAGRTRGALQIQDGCDEHCTYCIIPTVRGGGSSRHAGEIVAQARRMVDAGYRELALTGVHTGSYGQDHGHPDALVELLEQLEGIPGLLRIRLNSIEPGCVTDTLVAFAASAAKLCRHFHVPLQSGDDGILRRMGRRYRGAGYAERIHRIAEHLPGCAIGADVMVGFPGEGPEQFAATRDLIAAIPLTYLHVFSYSRREGTPAERLPGHAPRATKSDRARELIDLGEAKRLAFHRSHLQRTVQVLVEDVGAPGLATGLTDNYLRVRFPPGPGTATVRPNELVAVRVTQAREDLVFGERVAA